jgi:methionyl-tRNA formyltransferase
LSKPCDRIVFLGTPDFAAEALRSLIARGENVVAVITQPDRPRGRSKRLEPPAVKVLASSHNIPVYQPERIRDPGFQETFSGLKADLGVVAAYGQILPKSLLDAPTHGCINIHASLLPLYRGASPIQRAIIDGHSETGITIMQMDVGLDTGPMLLQVTEPIHKDDTAATLHDRLAALGGTAMVDALGRLRAGTLQAEGQDDEKASYASLLKKSDGRICWDASAEVVYNHVRGLFPWPGAQTTYEGARLKVFPLTGFSMDMVEGNPRPGTLLSVEEDALVVACNPGSVRIRELQLEGRKRLLVQDLLRGFSMEEGGCLEGP